MGHLGKFVLTGGPGIGKTTMIEMLAQRGFSIISETAREIIEEEKLNKRGFLPWENLYEFQKLVADRQIKKEAAISRTPIFLDRGIIDGHAYSVLGSIPIPKIIYEAANQRYEKVFFLEPLNNYVNDEARLEGQEQAKRIHEQIKSSYESFGYSLITIPPLPVQERIEFILKKSNLI